MVSDKEILEWAKKEYGEEWAKEKYLPMLRKVYEKKFKKNVFIVRDYVYVDTIPENDGRYETKGIVIDVQRVEYKGCPVCKKSLKKMLENGMCSHIKSPDDAVDLVIVNFELMLKDGNSYKFIATYEKGKFEDFDVGDEISVKIFRYNGKNYVDEINIIKRVSDEDNSVLDKENDKNDSDDNDYDVKDDGGKNKNEGKMIENDNDEKKNQELIKTLRIIHNVGGLAKSVFDEMIKKNMVDLKILEYVVEKDGKVVLNDDGIKLIGEV